MRRSDSISSARAGGPLSRLRRAVTASSGRVRAFLDDPVRGVWWLVLGALATALLLLWSMGPPVGPLRGSPILLFWLAEHRTAIVAVKVIVGMAAIVSVTAGWIAGAPLRGRLLVAWLIAALVASLALRPQLLVVVGTILR